MSLEFQFIPTALPIAPRPIHDELLSSWLHRVADANALSLGELLESARWQHLPGLTTVLDYGLSIAWRTRLAAFCRIPESWLRLIDLQCQFPCRNLTWFAHGPVLLRSPGEPAIQLRRPFCVGCGEEQRTFRGPTYIRAEWALAFRTHCPRHLTPLIDQCGSCRTITFPYWADGRFCCTQCHVTLKATHTVADSSSLRAVVRLQETIHGCFLGKHPEPHWFGVVSASRFLHVVGELIRILLYQASPGFVLADLLVPDEFRRRYNVGGRFLDPRFCSLPWFARFLVVTALNELVLAFAPIAVGRPAPRVAMGHLLNAFFGLLPSEQKADIFNRIDGWPPALKTAFHHAATMAQRPAIHRSFSPVVKYNTRPGRERHSTGLVQRIHIVETDSTR